MAIFDIFKKKKKKKEIAEKKEKEILKKEVLEEKVEKPKEKKISKKIPSLASKVLRSPYITEKSTELAQRGQYTFRVLKKANKTEIKKAIEELYGVNVEAVKIMKKPSKKRRLGRQEGSKPGFKKAIVKIKEGQKIDIFPSE